MAEWVSAGAMVASALASGVNTGVQQHYAAKSMEKQEEAQAEAERVQKAADVKAEEERLKALAKQQQSESGFDFGIDSTLAARYADAAQKWSAGTGATAEKQEEENPFYTRGLI